VTATLAARPHVDAGSPWRHVLQGGAALACGMGVGRFVFTPILPLMHAQAGLSAGNGANLATANYVGYFIGALLGTAAPISRSTTALRVSLLALTASLAAMPLTQATTAWLVLRLCAGICSALIFVIAVSALLGHLKDHPAHLPGWAFGGVGAGIALSGLLVLALRTIADWRAAWWAAAILAALLAIPSWFLHANPPEQSADTSTPHPNAHPRAHPHLRSFTALFASYLLEGVGYIIAGTFLVAAIGQSSPGWIGSGAWVLVGIAAVPSSALWAGLAKRRSRADLLTAALLIQAVGIALPAVIGGVGAALFSAALFGGTFIGVSTLALAAGNHLRFPRAVALLTAGYSVGQILGPVIATPLLHRGYHQALILGAIIVAAAALAAAVLRIGFPRPTANVPAQAGPAD
jgi:predicted MFS family arabinose efflux permease